MVHLALVSWGSLVNTVLHESWLRETLIILTVQRSRKAYIACSLCATIFSPMHLSTRSTPRTCGHRKRGEGFHVENLDMHLYEEERPRKIPAQTCVRSWNPAGTRVRLRAVIICYFLRLLLLYL